MRVAHYTHRVENPGMSIEQAAAFASMISCDGYLRVAGLCHGQNGIVVRLSNGAELDHLLIYLLFVREKMDERDF